MEIKRITKGNIKKLLLVDSPIVTAAVMATVLGNSNPVYAAIWTGVITFLDQMPTEQKEAFSEELLKDKLKEDLLGSNDFARAMRATVQAASDTASKEKIQLLARLLRTAVNTNLVRYFYEFKELVKLADDISPREFLILNVMDIYKNHGGHIGPKLGAQPPSGLAADKERYERQQSRSELVEMEYVDIDSGKKRRLTNLERRWELAADDIKETMNFSSGELNALMRRLLGKGCVFEVPIIRADGSSASAYKLSPLYFRLKSLVEKEDGQII